MKLILRNCIAIAALMSIGPALAQTLASPSVLRTSSAVQDQKVGEETISQDPPLSLWPPIGTTSAAILCIHGLGMHRGTYGEFANAMANRGVAVFAIDVRGFGTWYQKGQPNLDFDATLADIKKSLKIISDKYPQIPIFLLGESMGGAVALQAAQQNADLVSGLISSVPSNDRFGGLGKDLHITLRILTGGFKERFDVGSHVVQYATTKKDLRELWKNDPRGRNDFSPAELITFQHFMKQNLDVAEKVKELPVLVIQGARDKLVRPTGTWDVWDHLATPNLDIAVSANSEHLIFEYGQFSADDLRFVCDWINKRLAKNTVDDTAIATTKPSSPTTNPNLITVSAGPQNGEKLAITYWIELMREGKRYRCNNKTQFHSGDEIRLHVRSNVDGYAYILLKAGTTGKHAVLFPDDQTGRFNRISAQRDIALPTKSWLRFDNNAGQEKVSIIFSKRPLDPSAQDSSTLTAFVSSDRSGAKDLVPTRMELSWGDPSPVIIPSSLSNTGTALATTSVTGKRAEEALESNLVKVSFANPDGVLSVDVGLDHN